MTTDARFGGRTTPDVVFVGRATIDLTVRIPGRPDPGGVVFAEPLVATPGGKSLNQAMAMARLGGWAALVANAGDDHWGRQLAAALVAAGVDAGNFRLLPGVATGTAIVEVTPDGEGTVILSPSPAAELTAEDVERALVLPAKALVVQLDLDAPALLPLGEAAPGRLIVGNLLPRGPICAEVWDRLDVYVGNRAEVAGLVGDFADPVDGLRRVRGLGPAAAVVTLGAEGAAFSGPGGEGAVPTAKVDVVNTTGAGDAFLGSLVNDLTRGVRLSDAVAAAVSVGTAAVGRV